jgi:hypothetical protein
LILLTIHQRALPPRGVQIKQKEPSSLYQTCLNAVVAHGIPFRHLDPRPHFYSKLENALPYYLLKPPPPRRTRRYQPPEPAERIYLSTGTLVVVPDTLIQQWSTEILKHVHDNVLSYQIISKPSQPIPCSKDLMKLDILLLSHSRFAKEDDDGRLDDTGFTPCPYRNSHEYRNSKSPLLQLRWKRLIIDEGHVLGQGTTRLVSLAGRLHVERRWCVTGTVSNHMMGMDFGIQRTSSSRSDTGILTPPEDIISSRKPDQIDLKRFGTMLIDYFHVPPFYTMDIWNRYVIRPYSENLRGSMSSLRSIMSLMIRHRPHDIEKDVRLPVLHTKTIFLTPTRENRLSINVITALIASNAVLTQRCDQDYFFHPSQVKFRDEVVKNLMLGAFHFTGTSVESVIEALDRAHTGLEKAVERGYSDDDVRLLRRVAGCLEEAVGDRMWRTLAVKKTSGKEDTSQEMGMLDEDRADLGYILENCPAEISDAWGLPVPKNPLSGTKDDEGRLFSGPALLSMQSQLPFLADTPTTDHVASLIRIGIEIRERELAALQSKNINAIPAPRSDEEQKLRKVMQYEKNHYDLSNPDLPQKRPKRPSLQQITPPSSPLGMKSILKVSSKDLDYDSPLKKIHIHRTASAKLNYLLSQIQLLSPHEKVIVFSDYAPMMWYLGEALELLGINHLIYIQRLVPFLPSSY